mmetsp:Transcript_23818/g.21676  ORF Transcript_23818/g.21676 Transcript_23818/m.21676 type:complete len:630 (-) Transcript_23818:21-1910(-)
MKKQSTNDPPSIDENGHMINPHNPEFITKVPWYLGSSGPTLKHHNVQKSDHVLTIHETDNLILNKTNYNNNKSNVILKRNNNKQCTNCGSINHLTKDCVDRPRSKTNIKKAGYSNISNDIQPVNLEDYGKVSYDTKRDNYRGYDPKLYQEVINNFELIENERKLYKNKLKQQQLEEEASKEDSKEDVKEEDQPEINADSKEENKGDSSDSDTDDEYNNDDYDDILNKDNNIKDFQYRSQRQGGLGGNSMKITSRNLRIREDTPKYLRNLALDSAYYDPKSRSMRDNPYKDSMNNQSMGDLLYAGDNYLKQSGDTLKLAQSQVLCWEMSGDNQLEGADNQIDVLTNPSQAEMLYKKYQTIKEINKNKKKELLLEKYGQVGSMIESKSESNVINELVDKSDSKVNNQLPNKLTNELDIRLRYGQSELYIEYDRLTGQPINKSMNINTSKLSKYPEDIYINNHTSVWGSYYDIRSSSWGYKCCHSLIKMSYCVGFVDKVDNQVDTSLANKLYSKIDNKVDSKVDSKADKETNNKKVDKSIGISTKSSHSKQSDVYGSSNISNDVLDKTKVNQSIYLSKPSDNQVDKQSDKDEKSSKRNYNSMVDSNVSIEDMEAYRLSKFHRDDPMSKFIDI